MRELEKGVRPWLKPWNAEHAAGRITRPLARERHSLSGHQCPDAVVGSDGEGLRRADLDDLQAGAGTEGRMSARASKAALSFMPTRSSAPRPTPTTGEEAERAIPFMKGYTVFNVEQIDGLPEHYYAQARTAH